MFPFPDADALELTQRDGVAELRVDGEPSDARLRPSSSGSASARAPTSASRRSGIDGDYWEVKVSPL